MAARSLALPAWAQVGQLLEGVRGSCQVDEEAASDFFFWREEWEAGRRGRSHFAEAGRGKRRGRRGGMQEVAFKGRGRNIEGGGGGGAGCCSS